MKKIFLSLSIVICSAVFVMAQSIAKSDSSNPWRENLVAAVAKKFQLSADVAKKLVEIKERNFSQLIAYDMPNIETQMGKEQKAKAIESIKEKETSEMKSILKTDAKTKELQTYLEGKIPVEKASRKR